MFLTCGWFTSKSQENPSTSCWGIEKQGFGKGSKAGRGNTWVEVLSFKA
jgi:hypothetical protein